MPAIKLDGRTVYIGAIMRQISNADTIYCPKCGAEILYWQIQAHYSTAKFNNAKGH